DGCGQRLTKARVSLRRAHALDERAIARRVSRIAIVRQMRDTTIDQRVERGRLLSRLVKANERLDAHRVMPGASTPFKRLLVRFDRDSIKLNCAINRLPADRNQASLP